MTVRLIKVPVLARSRIRGPLRRWRQGWFLWLVLSALIVTGCASAPPHVAVEGQSESVAAGWWQMRFQLVWPEGEEVRWHLDALLANEVVAPVLREYQSQIVLWRFHRRASRDGAGHQFSFIFYASSQTANALYAQLQQNRILQSLREQELLIDQRFDNTGRIEKPETSDTSDEHWNIAMQRAWPYYIMGASELWLGLIQEQAKTMSLPETVPELVAVYQEINGRVSAIWRKDGEHALLHHLNAIFGYAPIEVVEKRLITF